MSEMQLFSNVKILALPCGVWRCVRRHLFGLRFVVVFPFVVFPQKKEGGAGEKGLLFFAIAAFVLQNHTPG